MSKPSPQMTVTECPGATYPDLQTAQRAALHAIATDLAAVIRRLLESGALVNDNGTIRPR
jgi:hypothetical protein